MLWPDGPIAFTLTFATPSSVPQSDEQRSSRTNFWLEASLRWADGPVEKERYVVREEPAASVKRGPGEMQRGSGNAIPLMQESDTS